MTTPATTLLVVSCGLLALACSTLPEHAAPKGEVVDPAELDMSDVIPYRTLVRDDFKGTVPPPGFAPHADTVGAATCGHILTTPETKLRVQPLQGGDGRISYRAVADQLRFHAQMDRNCSWWNPRDTGVPETYILEHEQIHFALFELEARRLNASAPEIASAIDTAAPTPDAAAERAQRKLEDQIRDRVAKILKRSRAFDEDTSAGYRPERQRAWLRRVQAELAETQRWAQPR